VNLRGEIGRQFQKERAGRLVGGEPDIARLVGGSKKEKFPDMAENGGKNC
jgi:hypothetical protein